MGLRRVRFGPAIRIELKWIFEEFLLEMVWLDLDRNKNSFLQWNFTNVMVLDCHPSEEASIRTVHPQSFLEDIVEVSELSEVLIGDIVDIEG